MVYKRWFTETARKKPFATHCCERLYEVGDTGLEPVTPSLSSNSRHNASEANKGLASTPAAACTSACTSDAETGRAGGLNAKAYADQEDPLTKLAAALLTLSPADRQRLAAMLAGQQDAGEGERRPA